MNNSFEEFVFTDGEIKEQLKLLGFNNINEQKFQIFKEDLKRLITSERLSEESQIFQDELNKIRKEKLHVKPSDNEETYSDISSTIITSNDSDYDQEIAKYNDNPVNRKVLFNDSEVSESTISSNERRIKRKVMRKLPTGASKTYSNYIIPKYLMQPQQPKPSNMYYLNDDFNNMNLNQDDDEDHDELLFDDGNGEEAEEEEQFDLVEKCESQASTRQPVKSFIRSQSSLSTRFEDPSRVRKSNPVTLYHQYAKTWSKQKAPGEKNHNNLRWAIREKLLDKHVIVKQSIIQPVNKYQIPTEKKRQDLRWSIRSALANVSKN